VAVVEVGRAVEVDGVEAVVGGVVLVGEGGGAEAGAADVVERVVTIGLVAEDGGRVGLGHAALAVVDHRARLGAYVVGDGLQVGVGVVAKRVAHQAADAAHGWQ